jgi:hypothetical protein
MLHKYYGLNDSITEKVRKSLAVILNELDAKANCLAVNRQLKATLNLTLILT